MWLLWTGTALARSWCAAPVQVHEWGVQLFTADGSEVRATELPAYFHGAEGVEVAATPVRTLPADNGARTLPVVQVWGRRGDEVPLALEVGFTEGSAAVWYPQVDRRIDPLEARSPRALLGRAELQRARAERAQVRADLREPLGPDPTRQLGWDALTFRPAPAGQPAATMVPWVEDLRGLEALWAHRGDEVERFVFYEADTTERPAVVVEPGQLRNTSDWTVHDVLLRVGGLAVYIAAIPPGATAAFTLTDDLPVLATLRERWVDAAAPVHDPEWSMDHDDCVMMRDPAIPVEQASGHRLYGAEVDVLLSVWAERFTAPGPLLIYREDPAALDALMPLSVYTDQRHFLDLRRLGVVLVEGVEVP